MSKEKVADSLKSPRFCGIKTFMRMPYGRDLEKLDFTVLGIPFDSGASYRVGTRFGPEGIRGMSCLAAKPYNPVLEVGIFDECNGSDYGDLENIPGYIEESFDLIEKGMLPIFEHGVIPVAMGGDHSVTLPELRACAKVYGPVALIHFDAHYDTIPEYFGKPYNHGTPFHHAAIEGLVDTSHSIHVGIREGLYSPADSAHSEELGYECLNAHIMHQMSMQDVVKKICDRVGDKKAFVTFDIDFLDPAYAPGTGTPVPGGFSTAQAYELVRGLKDLNIVGYDMVEVSPPYDPTQATSIAAAGIMQEFLSQIAYRKRKNS
ncbi:MAG: agmatinase [Clostridiales bacterium]|uniref:agmatinase n=1 Tax=Roseburia sp. MSJ-14 TaxID=2841514 RepID=UPI00169D7E1E|nr:agmatinase [Roseburia sp. MSJ-14]MBU5472260.1 agmatinase [Roseburia sp. MSJ-14]NLK78861.1 agmatinase [Clostridiales bacterium]